MCQVTPFTYPCCRRIYVLVEKLPNCPADWPRSKCPQELCIQVINPETAEIKHSSLGTCWRCKAAADGKSADERENMRPEIDRAVVVEGLEEFDVSERKQRVEAGGTCWYCNARHGCSKCGTTKLESSPEPATSPIPPRKKRHFGITPLPRKKPKCERGGGTLVMPSRFKSQPLPRAMSQRAFSQPSQMSAVSPYVPTTSLAQDGFLAYSNLNNSHPPTISESGPSAWQSGPPYTGYTSFWESFNNTQGHGTATVSQGAEVIGSKTNGHYHPPGPGMVMGPGGITGHNQVSCTPMEYWQ